MLRQQGLNKIPLEYMGKEQFLALMQCIKCHFIQFKYTQRVPFPAIWDFLQSKILIRALR